MQDNAWIPVNNYPGDQQYDGVPGTEDTFFWGTIGPDGTGGWSWTINATTDVGDQWEEDGGNVASEAEAKAAVEGWTPRLRKEPTEGKEMMQGKEKRFIVRQVKDGWAIMDRNQYRVAWAQTYKEAQAEAERLQAKYEGAHNRR